MIDWDEVGVQLQQYRDAVYDSLASHEALPQMVTVLDSVVEELNTTIEELGLQNEELHLSSYLQEIEARRYHEMFDEAPVAHVITDLLGVIREANIATGAMLNVEPRLLHGKPLSVYIDQSDRRAYRRLLRNVADFDMRQVIELTVQPRGRAAVSTEVTVSAASASFDESVWLMWVFREVSARDRRLREINATNAMLQERLAKEVARLREVTSERDAAIARESTAHWLAESASRKLAFLAEASETLGEGEEAGRALAMLLSCVVPSMADWGVVALVDDNGELVESIVAHEHPERDLALKRRIGSGSFQPGSMLVCGHDVLRSGMPHSFAKGEKRPPDANECLALDWITPENAQECSILSVPLRSRGQTLGVLELGRGRSWAPFDSDDLSYVLVLAGRSSGAFDATRLAEHSRVASVTRDQFLAVAAHELRTPITVFRGYAQILSRLLASEDEIDRVRACRMASAIEQQADRLAALVEQLVDATRLESRNVAVQRAPTDLSCLVMNQIENAQAATELHRIDGHVEASVIGLVDGVRFEQVVAHLLDNAIKFSLDGGTITVTLGRISDSTARISVSDHGIGLKPEYRHRIFDPFFIAHDRTNIKGLGLGLYISREIMHLHGGDLRVEFPSGFSTCFVAEFPLQLREDAPVTD